MSDRFTVVFKGDIRAFDGNPLHIVSPFGEVAACGEGDAFEAADTIEALRAENAKLDWQDMKTAPTDGTFIIAGLRVYSAKDKSFFHWDVYAVAKDDETGDAITMSGDDCGWLWEDFEVWKPLNLKAATARAAMGESDE